MSSFAISSLVPWCWILPSNITYALSVIDNVALGLWSVIRTPSPLSERIFILSLISPIAIGSIPAKGSSKRINSGLAANALAISTLLLSPPDKATAEVFLNFFILNSSRSSSSFFLFSFTVSLSFN